MRPAILNCDAWKAKRGFLARRVLQLVCTSSKPCFCLSVVPKPSFHCNLFQWFSPAEFGMWYSILNTTMNLACSVGPVLTTFITAAISWRASMTMYGKCRCMTFPTILFCVQSSLCVFCLLCSLSRLPPFCFVLKVYPIFFILCFYVFLSQNGH